MKKALAVEIARHADVSKELSGADFGDARLSKRAVAVGTALAKSPGSSLPLIMADDAELTGTYRFANNARVEPQPIVAPHIAATVRRARLVEEVLVVHDTTESKYAGEKREGLGTLSSGGEGFFAHVSLVVALSGGIGVPLGVSALQLYTREPGRKKQPRRLPLLDEGNERRRWAIGVEQTTEALGNDVEQIHVLDREGDHYELLACFVEKQRRFVVRLSYDRVLDAIGPHDARHLSEALASVSGVFTREVHIDPRKASAMPAKNRKHPPREERDAVLSYASTRVRLKRPHAMPATLPAFLEVSVVRVWEQSPPAGQQPIEWILVTSEPVEAPDQIQRVADIYRFRWLIEEFFKALKSGCAVQRRRFLDVHALQNIFALAIPVAWHMLLIRALSRLEEQPSAKVVLSSLQLALLAACTRKLPPSQRLPPEPTVRQALLSIAALGGHLTRNGDPGWLTLARGHERLLLSEEGYQLGLQDGRHASADV